MALPVILVNSATGSDTAASGAGPAVALSGTANASTDGAGTTVTLPAGTDLTNVLTDGSHAIFISDATAGARNFGKITGKAGSGGATPTVTVANAFGLNLANKDWAIGGKRASILSTTSKKLLENNSAAGDAMPGWAVEMESAHAETQANGWTVRRSGDATDGAIVVRGTFGAGTLPLLNHSSNNAFITIGNGIGFVQFRDFEYRNTNATKTASIAFSAANNTISEVIVERVKVAHQTNNVWRAFQMGSFASRFLIARCELAYCADAAIFAAAQTNFSRFQANRIHHCTGDGITLSAGGGSAFIKGSEIFSNGGHGINVTLNTNSCYRAIEENTIYGNAGDGIRDTTGTGGGLSAWQGSIYANNILANNGGYGLKFDGAGMTAAVWTSAALNYGNQTFGNTSGPCSLVGVLSGDTGLDPQFTSSTDLRIGANLRSQGYPTDNNPGTTYRTYVNPGANQPSARQAAVGDVRFNTSYADGTFTGIHTDPDVGDVRVTVQWGAGGTEFTGTYTAAADYPAVGKVAAGVGYNFGALVGTRTDANPAHVLAGDTYGAGGTQFTGTLVVPTTPAPASASPASDWRVWDNREAVSYTVTIRAGDLTYPAVANCKRRQLQRRELEASNGAYVAGDRNWLVPVEMLPANVAPKVSDRITDAQGVVWSVLEAQLNTWQSWWRLTCRNLVLVADLRELVTLLQPSTTQDAAGGRVPTYTAAVSGLPAKVLEVEAAADDRLGKRQAVRRYTAWVGQRVFPAANWRLKDAGGQVYTILGWRAADRFDVLQALDLEVVK